MSSERNIISRYKKLNEDTVGLEERPEIELSSVIPYRDVMSAYQNANKWLDSIKETVLMDFNCVFYSNVVHTLAHTMPGRFDKFGDILHTCNIRVPYPSTQELMELPTSVDDSIDKVLNILDMIKDSLFNFKYCCESQEISTLVPSNVCVNIKAMSLAVDPMIGEISNEYHFYNRIKGMLPTYQGRVPEWDEKVNEYFENINKLL